jgi:fructose-bisphosphate aldolase class II
MPLVPMRQILDEAAKGGYGVGAFNVKQYGADTSNYAGCKRYKSPVIIQASEVL